MGLPAACRLDHLVPGPPAGLDGPAPIRQGRARTAHSVGGASPVGKRWEDGAAPEEEAPREQRPEPPAQTQIRADGPVGSDRTQQERKTVDAGRHRASRPASRVERDNATLPENLPDVGLTTAIYRKLKSKTFGRMS